MFIQQDTEHKHSSAKLWWLGGCNVPSDRRSGQRPRAKYLGTAVRMCDAATFRRPIASSFRAASHTPLGQQACRNLRATATRLHEESGGDERTIGLIAMGTSLTAIADETSATLRLRVRRRVGPRGPIMSGGARGRGSRSTASLRARPCRLLTSLSWTI